MRNHITEIAIVAWSVAIILIACFLMSCDVPDDTELP